MYQPRENMKKTSVMKGQKEEAAKDFHSKKYFLPLQCNFTKGVP